MENISKPTKQIIVEYTISKKFLPIISWVIRFFQWRFWSKQKFSQVPSHVRIRFFDKKHGVWWVYEASGSYLKLIGLTHSNKKHKVIRTDEFYVSPEIKKDMVLYMNKMSGSKYPRLQLLGLGIVKFLKFFRIRINNPFANGESLQICVEALYFILKFDNRFIEELKKYKPDSIDLCDTIDIINKIKSQEIGGLK